MSHNVADAWQQRDLPPLSESLHVEERPVPPFGVLL